MVMSFIGRPRLIVYNGQIPRDGITSENYFLKSQRAFEKLFHVSSEVIYAEL